MQSNTAVSFLPIITEDRKVDVSICESEAVIKLSTWTEGLGWCGQKTMSLDAQMLEELHRAISAARVRLSVQNDESPNGSAKVLDFPRVS